MPVQAAGRLALALLLPPAGVVLYARAAWGSWSPWPVAAALLACNATFLIGFVNFLIGIGLALATAAA
jgi:hypothetical protein